MTSLKFESVPSGDRGQLGLGIWVAAKPAMVQEKCFFFFCSWALRNVEATLYTAWLLVYLGLAAVCGWRGLTKARRAVEKKKNSSAPLMVTFSICAFPAFG